MSDDADAATRVLLAAVTGEPLSVEACARLVDGHDAGAVVTFAGVVRDHDGGRRVVRLDYSAHPDASAVLAEVATAVVREHPAVRVAVAHRIGELEVGETALACAVGAPHRREAFEACTTLVDEVKRLIPVWKEQRFSDGTSEWVGSA